MKEDKTWDSEYDVGLSNPESVYELCKKIGLAYSDREKIIIFALDCKMNLIGFEEVAKGTLNKCVLVAKDILKFLILCNAYGCVLAHNHVSQNTTPSEEDIGATEMLRAALNSVGIVLMDHVVVGMYDYHSICSEEVRNDYI